MHFKYTYNVYVTHAREGVLSYALIQEINFPLKKTPLLKRQCACTCMCIYVSKNYCTYFFFVTCIKSIDAILSKEYKNAV